MWDLNHKSTNNSHKFKSTFISIVTIYIIHILIPYRIVDVLLFYVLYYTGLFTVR
jgi:hypothetical protein